MSKNMKRKPTYRPILIVTNNDVSFKLYHIGLISTSVHEAKTIDLWPANSRFASCSIKRASNILLNSAIKGMSWTTSYRQRAKVFSIFSFITWWLFLFLTSDSSSTCSFSRQVFSSWVLRAETDLGSPGFFNLVRTWGVTRPSVFQGVNAHFWASQVPKLSRVVLILVL